MGISDEGMFDGGFVPSIEWMKLVTHSFQSFPLNWILAFSVPSSSNISIRTFILLPLS